MALGDYTPTAWVNGTTPAINATNLGHIETKIDEIDAASVATTGTIIWSTSNDGNGGEPPTPKPQTGVNGPGYVRNATYLAPATFIPSGGTWMYIYASGTNLLAVDVVAGGTQIAANADISNSVICWRIS